MEFRDVLAQRRMHRAFLPDPIPREQIERIAGVIRHAPSGGFSQGASIVAVTGEAMRRAIAERFEAGNDWYAPAGERYIASAPVHMVISANESLYHARYNEPDKLRGSGGVEITWPVPYWFVDAGALMMLVLMAAIAEGLASAFIGHPEQQEIFADLLGLPDEVVPLGLALIGKAAPDPVAERATSRRRERRRPTGDLIHWGRW